LLASTPNVIDLILNFDYIFQNNLGNRRNMTSKERFLKALNREKPDRLPVTTHHVMQYFLDKYMGGISDQEFFDYFGMDPIKWLVPMKANPDKGEYLMDRYILSDKWIINISNIEGLEYPTIKYEITTPEKKLTTCLQNNDYTQWNIEHLIKEKSDIDILEKYMPWPTYDVEEVNKSAVEYGTHGLIRGHIMSFNIFGQPGCWQDASCLYGIENLIMETYDDPEWVHHLLQILMDKKMICVNSLKGANYDLLELGGGDASSTVISPKLLEEFVIPYDKQIIDAAHKLGQKIVYHTCGGMMPILEILASMNPDALETLTPPAMGADVVLSEVKKRVGDKVCLIGGFDQFNGFNCTLEETRAMVKRNFMDAGQDGGYILSPSDHFFDANPENIKAYADEAKKCIYK
jgi:uroporphyrinogen decarboxylase